VAAQVQDMFKKFYFVKKSKIDHNSATVKPREKMCMDSKSFKF
jgi:hypothetical protein